MLLLPHKGSACCFLLSFIICLNDSSSQIIINTFIIPVFVVVFDSIILTCFRKQGLLWTLGDGFRRKHLESRDADVQRLVTSAKEIHLDEKRSAEENNNTMDCVDRERSVGLSFLLIHSFIHSFWIFL